MPLFSLRTHQGLGIGEFNDLKILIDWAEQSGIGLIQILPVNDTSVNVNWKDSYPYSSLSAFALHPIYLHLQDFGLNLSDHTSLLGKEQLDYEEVYAIKIKFMEGFFQKRGFETLESVAYQKFEQSNRYWLLSYALFCSLRDHFGTCDFRQWQDYARINFAQVETLAGNPSPFFERAQFYKFLQFHLDRQFNEVVNHAKAKGIQLKGDFAVGVNRNSVDPWIYPQAFAMDKSIGAPPDYYNSKGQNWGFPGYAWKALEETHFEWFCKRLQHLSEYFDYIRIDHILGYFRFWEIPAKFTHGVMGHFNPCRPIRKIELIERGLYDIDRLIKPYDDKTIALDPEQELANVILFKDETEEDAYHFRFNMQSTGSFAALTEQEKEALLFLYEDYFFKRQDPLWEEEALKKLPCFLKASPMVVCAEDLGFVPACVKEVLQTLRILELYIQRMPKKSGQRFGIPSEYSYLSVCSPSNHDTSSLRAWWEEDRSQREAYAKEVLNIDNPPEKCVPEICEMILKQHLESPSMWAIFMLHDLLALKPAYCIPDPKKEQINDPTNPEHYWRFRYPFYLEDLVNDQALSRQIKELISQSGRDVKL